MDLFRAVVLGLGQALTGTVVGMIVDDAMNAVYPSPIQPTQGSYDWSRGLIRILIQLPVGMVVLSSMMLIITQGKNLYSPSKLGESVGEAFSHFLSVGDGTLLFFFFFSQPGMLANILEVTAGAWAEVKGLFGGSSQSATPQ